VGGLEIESLAVALRTWRHERVEDVDSCLVGKESLSMNWWFPRQLVDIRSRHYYLLTGHGDIQWGL